MEHPLDDLGPIPFDFDAIRAYAKREIAHLIDSNSSVLALFSSSIVLDTLSHT